MNIKMQVRGGGVGMLFLATTLEAQVFWHYEVSDGIDTMSGSFTTFGSFEDLQGRGHK